jgi:hypothetical protein
VQDMPGNVMLPAKAHPTGKFNGQFVIDHHRHGDGNVVVQRRQLKIFWPLHSSARIVLFETK